MNQERIIRAWKDPEFRARLDERERATLPVHPAGRALTELEDGELEAIFGGRIKLRTTPRYLASVNSCPLEVSWDICSADAAQVTL